VSLFSAVADFLKPAPPPAPVVEAARDRVIGGVDPILRVLPHLDRQLAPAVEHALGYCEGLVAALPGPITIDRKAFGTDPLVHALFATAGDIDDMLGRSQAIRDAIAHPENWRGDHFHAMLAARRQQKRQFGMAQQGDIIRNDVVQEILFFSDQTLVEPSCDLETTRRKLREKALDSLLHSFNAHVEQLRREREGLRTDASAEQAYLAHHPAADPHTGDGHTRHLAELDFRLRQHAEALMPEHLAATLGDFLKNPESALRLRPIHVAVDRLGVVHPDAADGERVQTLDFPELISRDRRQHLAMLVTIPCQDAIAAVDKARDRQRRFMLI
jgi:hypothetical protein